jgi:hypothetical protein
LCKILGVFQESGEPEEGREGDKRREVEEKEVRKAWRESSSSPRKILEDRELALSRTKRESQSGCKHLPPVTIEA